MDPHLMEDLGGHCDLPRFTDEVTETQTGQGTCLASYVARMAKPEPQVRQCAFLPHRPDPAHQLPSSHTETRTGSRRWAGGEVMDRQVNRDLSG